MIALASTGCAGAEAMTLPPLPAPRNELGAQRGRAQPRRDMAFEVRLGGVLAGEAELAVGELGSSTATAP